MALFIFEQVIIAAELKGDITVDDWLSLWVLTYLSSVLRLHGRYHELAPHLVPMDYTKEPDCKLPLALIVAMPELNVR